MSCIDIKLGYTCNNNCIHCVISSNREYLAKKNKKNDRDTQECKKELLDSKSQGYDMIVLTGGEPTIRKDFLIIVDYAKSLGYKITLQTNGRMFYYKEFAKKLAKYQISYTIALHGDTEETHDNISRVNGSFKQTVNGIKNLIDLKQKIWGKVVISKKNYKNLKNIAKLFLDLGIYDINFAFPHPQGSAWKNFHDVVPTYTEIEPFIRETINYGEEYSKEKNVKTWIDFEAIPFCFMIGNEKNISEIHYKEKGKVGVKPVGEEVVDWQKRRLEIKKKFPQCIECRYNSLCEGVWEEYPKKYGSDEFKPIKDAFEVSTLKPEEYEKKYVSRKDTKINRDLAIKNAKNLLIINFNGIGDVIKSMYLVDILKEAFDNPKITILVKKECGLEGLFKITDNTNIISIPGFKWGKNDWEFYENIIKKVKDEYDIIFDLNDGGDELYSIFFNKLRGKTKIGFKTTIYKQLDFIVPFEKEQNQGLYVLTFLDVIGIDVSNYFLRKNYFKLFDQYEKERVTTGKFFLEDKNPKVVLCIQTTKSQKEWGIENFIILAEQLITHYNYSIIFLGDRKDENVEKIERSNKKILNLLNKTTINECINIIKESDLVISNDSGLMHIADMLNKKLIALFGPTLPSKFGPINNNSIVIDSNRNPKCKNKGESLNYGSHCGECIKQINVANVIEAVEKIMGVKCIAK